MFNIYSYLKVDSIWGDVNMIQYNNSFMLLGASSVASERQVTQQNIGYM